MAAPVTPALTFISQASLNQGQTPEDWKLANVSPIFKKGDKSKPAKDQNILTDYQHGFRKKRSCES